MCLLLAVGGLSACTPPPPTEDLTVWQPLGTWSGRVGQQTDPFTSTTGLLRITWEARDLHNDKAEGKRQKVEGTFRIIVHSDVSGRPLLAAVDRRGPGKDVTYITEDPRSFFLVVESDGLDWSIAVAEGIPAKRR